MKLIPLEEAEKVFQKYIHLAKKNHHKTITIPMFEVVADDIKEIPTIDPFSTIDEMIEEYKNDSVALTNAYRIDWLQELKSRLSLTQK